MTRLLPVFLLLSLFLSHTGFAQEHFCGTKTFVQETNERTDISEAEKAELIRGYEEKMAAFEKQIRNAPKYQKENAKYIIPVVFHIIHNFGPENISDAQVYDQIRIMNEEFRKMQASFANVHPEFAGIAADNEIEFRLVTKTPDGKCTNGIHRYVNPGTNFTSMQQIQKLKPQIFWPSDKYLNCMVVGTIESSGGGRTLGFAQFPFWGSDNTDGVVMVHDAIGAIGTGVQRYASVTTHEVGHWLGLYHTWGRNTAAGSEEACQDDDEVEDTPNTKGSPSVCDLNEKSCGVLANVQNFMDYSFCYVMFTEGQKARMHNFLNMVPKRKNLWQQSNLELVGADYTPGNEPELGFCLADFNHSASEPVCLGTEVQFQDVSFSGVKTWKWSFPGGSPSISTEQHPKVYYGQPGTYSVTLQVSDNNETRVVTKTNSVRVMSAGELGTSYQQGFESLNLSTDKDFKVVNQDEDVRFEITDKAGYSGSKSLYFHNYIASKDRTDELVSTTIDFSQFQNPRFTFRFAYTPKTTTTFDELGVYISTDCGKTWTRKKILKGTQLKTASPTTNEFVPDSQEEWAEATVDVSSYKVPNVMFKFEWKSGGGNNLYIDDINITDFVGVSENSLLTSRFTVQPNPAAEAATLQFDITADMELSIDLTDLTGKSVRSFGTRRYSYGENSVAIDRNDLAPGLYLIRIKEKNQTIVKKLSFN